MNNNGFKPEYIEMSDGTFFQVDILTKEYFSSQTNNKNNIENQYSLTFNTDELIVYVLKDNSTIVCQGYTYCKFSSERIFKDYFQKLTNEYSNNEVIKSQHILKNINIYGNMFDKHVRQLIDNLKLDLRINHDNIDLSLIQEVDREISAMKDSILIYMKYYLNLIALIGEVLRVDYNGAWDMLFDKSDGIWTPRLNIRDNFYDIAVKLYKEIFIYQSTGSFIASDIYQRISVLIYNSK